MAPSALLPSLDPDGFPIFQREMVQSQHHHLLRRDLSVNQTQAVTVGIIGVYVVVIALLWNIPYVRNVLWPFKVFL